MYSRIVIAALATALMAAKPVWGQRIIRQSFEGDKPLMRLGLTDGQVRLLEHDITVGEVHGGKQAERLLIRAAGASYCFVEFPVANALVFEELTVSAWVHCSQPGPQLLARVVLPREKDEKTGEPVVTILRGDRYEVARQWRLMVIRRPDLALQKQQQLLQSQRKRKVDIADAYMDKLYIDVAGTTENVELIVDDVEIGPVVFGKTVDANQNDPVPLPLRSQAGDGPRPHIPDIRNREQKANATVVADRLEVGGRGFLMRGIYRTDSPLELLQEAGFNTLLLDWPASEQTVHAADELGLKTAPMLAPRVGRQSTSFASASNAAVDFRLPSLFYHLGSELDGRAEPAVTATVDEIRAHDPRHERPLTGDVSERVDYYSRRLDLIGLRRDPLMTSLPPDGYRRWLLQRRNIAKPGTMFWNWIQAQPDEQYSNLVFGHGVDERFGAPVGPQPEQIRLLAYASFATGSRGMVLSSDKSMSGAMHGRDRALQYALLNLELTLIEPFLAEGLSPVEVRTSHPHVGAVVFQHPRGTLVLAYWKHPTCHYVIGQAAVSNLQVLIENAPEAAQAFQVSLGEVRGLRPQRGARITIPEFDTVALVVVTSDVKLFGHYQELVQQFRPQVADWENELAEITLRKTEVVDAKISRAGGAVKDVQPLLFKAHEHMQRSRDARSRHDYRAAIAEAMRGRRLARYAQDLHWSAAVKGLASPVADPFAVSFYSLPASRVFQQAIGRAQFQQNMIPSGNFERRGHLDAVGWTYSVRSADPIEPSAVMVRDQVEQRQQVLELRCRPRPGEAPPLVVENTRVTMISPAVRVEAGQVAKITGYVHVPGSIGGSVDGVMIWDSIAGESLALRFPHTSGWQPFVLYRPIRQSGQLRVHLALTGLGAAQFDNLAVQTADEISLPLAGQADPPFLR